MRTFLLYEFDQFSFGYRADATAPIQNKVGAFLADPLLNRILTAPEKDLRIRRIMDGGQVLLVNLAKGRIGDDSSSLLGGLLVTAIGLAAHSRADMPEAQRRAGARLAARGRPAAPDGQAPFGYPQRVSNMYPIVLVRCGLLDTRRDTASAP